MNQLPARRTLLLSALLLGFSPRLPAQTLDAVIDNGTVRVGVSRAYGGAITWLSTSGGSNLVNNADKGRQIQQSYYAGASRRATNQCPGWSPWTWNPIMVGDCAGHSSPVLTLAHKDGRIDVKTQPMLWDRSNVVSQSYIELRIAFHPSRSNVVVVENRFTCFRHRDDEWGGPVDRQQEIPACYFVSSLNSIRSYTGATPWTEGPLSVVPNVFMWTNFVPTEKWAACVDAAGFGAGIYSPDATSMNAGKFGKQVTANPFDGSTMHMAPLVNQAFDRNSVYDYRCFLVVGKLGEIRSAVYGLRREKPVRAF